MGRRSSNRCSHAMQRYSYAAIAPGSIPLREDVSERERRVRPWKGSNVLSRPILISVSGPSRRSLGGRAIPISVSTSAARSLSGPGDRFRYRSHQADSTTTPTFPASSELPRPRRAGAIGHVATIPRASDRHLAADARHPRDGQPRAHGPNSAACRRRNGFRARDRAPAPEQPGAEPRRAPPRGSICSGRSSRTHRTVSPTSSCSASRARPKARDRPQPQPDSRAARFSS
jgi:hypothetical protein